MLPHVSFALSLLLRWLMSAEQFDPSVVSHLTTFRYIHIAVATVRPITSYAQSLSHDYYTGLVVGCYYIFFDRGGCLY